MTWWRFAPVLLFAPLLLAPQERPGIDAAAAFAAALADYRDGAYEQALRGFERLLAASGDDADPRLRLNAGLCALRLLRSNDAEQLVAPLFEHERWAAEAAFVLGLAAHQQAERSAMAARLPDADPIAWVMAVRAAQRAELLFRRCCELRSDWPEAVRNLERALRARQRLERERDAAIPPDAKKEQAPDEPKPPEPKPREASEEVFVPEAATAPLGARQLEQLQRRVQQQRREKLRSRRERSEVPGQVGRRDW